MHQLCLLNVKGQEQALCLGPIILEMSAQFLAYLGDYNRDEGFVYIICIGYCERIRVTYLSNYCHHDCK
jgi:hypothetical protein